MNKERLLLLANLIEGNKALEVDGISMDFDMAEFGGPIDDADCKTAACIAGWAVLQFDGKEGYSSVMADPQRMEAVQSRAAHILGLEKPIAEQLFMTRMPIEFCQRVKPSKAAEVIRAFVETGVVSWN